MFIPRFRGHGYKEANQEEEQHNHDKRNRVLESSPEFTPNSLCAFLRSNLVVFFIPKIRKRHHQQAQNGIQAVQGVVDNLQLQQNVVHGIGCGPIFLRSQFSVGSR